jgi:ATP-dependent RNA helicase DeaD
LTETSTAASFGRLPDILARAITARGYDELTAVQSAVIDPEALGRDMLVSAQTGSGKTVAFGLAMADSLLTPEGRVHSAAAPLALVVAPTRELALQVSREFEWLYGATGARTVTCVGGMDASRERRSLAQGAHIVVGTPGRLRDHLERGALDLTAIRAVVLDEADEMLDMGFREDLEEILDATPETRRTLLFSATIPKPIEALARRYQRDALRISTRGQERGHSDIAYQAVTIAPADIENAVVNILRLHEAETAILFCATRDNVRHLHASLVERGFSVVALSGEHSQNERNHALQALRDQRARVCVATDVAARGIDLPSLSLVIHVELPRDAEALQHRSGRTGRAGKKGIAVLLVPYPRRKRIESLLRGAKINAEWIPAPGPEDIRKADRTRLLETLRAPVELDDDDREMGAELLAGSTPEEIAAMLVRAYRARLPQPEDLIAGDKASARPEGPRPGFEGSAWFRMNVGRQHNADPRWILPLLCRRGHITRNDVGAIRITGHETLFEVAAQAVAKFAAAVKRTAKTGDDEGELLIEACPAAPREQARQNRHATRANADSPRPPFRKGGKSSDRGPERAAERGPGRGPGPAARPTHARPDRPFRPGKKKPPR